MNEVYNGGFAPEFSVSMLQKIIALVWDYVYETRKLKKTAEKYKLNWSMRSSSNETLNFFLSKVLDLQHFRSCQNCMSSANLVLEIQLKLLSV